MKKTKKMLSSLSAGLAFTFLFAAVLYFSGRDIDVILPSSAPVWMGISSMCFMMSI